MHRGLPIDSGRPLGRPLPHPWVDPYQTDAYSEKDPSMYTEKICFVLGFVIEKMQCFLTIFLSKNMFDKIKILELKNISGVPLGPRPNKGEK